MRARGLKQVWHEERAARLEVAPHAGAWVETGRPADASATERVSRPMRARGLKHNEGGDIKVTARMSRPMRARGLKLVAAQLVVVEVVVAPHAGAWVETLLLLP